MPRKLQPCGTPAAFQRHKYKGEKPCAECRRAYNLYESQRRARKEARTLEMLAGSAPPAGGSGNPVAPEPVVPDPGPAEGESLGQWRERKLLESVARLEVAMERALPRELAGLVRQHTEIVTVLSKGDSEDSSKGSVLDELAKRRAERVTAS